LERLDRAARELLAWEQQARDALWTRARSLLEDWIWRSYGLLRHARMLTAEEVLKHASAVRLGVALGVLTVPVRVLNEILVDAQPAHVQILGGTSEASHASIWRATMVREKLRQLEG
jgi:protein arginine kinase